MDWEPLIIAVAPNGARKNKNDHPGVPITPAEIAREAARCLEAGASMIHLHVRDEKGRHTLDAEAYRAAQEAVFQAVGDRIVVQVTSEASGVYQPQAQMDAVKAIRPESVSLALRELVPDANRLAPFATFLEWLVREAVTPQYILFSPDEVAFYADLRDRGVIPSTPHWLLFVLGRYPAEEPSSACVLLPFLGRCRAAVPWAECAFGRGEHRCASAAVALGGHVRVGFENNSYLKDGSVAETNAQLIQQVYDVARAVGRPVADADTLRAMFATG